MDNTELKEQVKLLGEVLEKLQGQFSEALEAAYREGAVDGCWHAGGQATDELINAHWEDSETKETIDKADK